MIDELGKHLENLKGDYLKQIIKKITKLKNKMVICENNSMCIYTRDFNKNYLMEVF